MNAGTKRFAKVVLGHALVRSGLWKRSLQMWAERRTVIILTYHRVIEKWDRTLDYSGPGIVVTASTFDRHIAFLKEHFEIVTFDALLGDGSTAGRTTRPRCIVTFDDGWRDNYDLAFPILRRHDIPATIYLATDFIGTNRVSMQTELVYLLTNVSLAALSDALPRPVPRCSRLHRQLKRLARLGRAVSAHDVDPLIDALKLVYGDHVLKEFVRSLAMAARLPTPLVPSRPFFLDWDQVRAMAAAGIEIGSHTCSHRMMTRLPEDQARDELIRSKTEIERRIGRRVKHFAFPHDDANSPLLVAAAKAGYRTACVGGDLVRQAPSAIRCLRRLGMNEAVSGDGRSFGEALLHQWLFRAPKEPIAMPEATISSALSTTREVGEPPSTPREWNTAQ
jgi:peptidoglycan/xylan/chitin deacetylase (PgdA/CDA1 family)